MTMKRTRPASNGIDAVGRDAGTAVRLPDQRLHPVEQTLQSEGELVVRVVRPAHRPGLQQPGDPGVPGGVDQALEGALVGRVHLLGRHPARGHGGGQVGHQEGLAADETGDQQGHRGLVALAEPAAFQRLEPRAGGHRLDLALTSQEAYLRLAGRAVHHSPGTLTLGIPTDGSAAHVRALLDEIDPAGREIERFSLHSVTLDDVFLALTSNATTANATTTDAHTTDAHTSNAATAKATTTPEASAHA
ncbi:predicted protein [Streptomyces filamentosus NRRL 15998]|uniref:Predicted protein n=1 Tax=Streptomyces filamentosus NRRL 15998 TaxID=457431 RepID=D6API1_STRFL|nr:predicted protein [Streptomyces filamentosus NRRL 15998]